MDWILHNYKIVSFYICDHGKAVLCLKVLGEDPTLLLLARGGCWQSFVLLGIAQH